MNTFAVYRCLDCKKESAIPLVRIPDWNKLCPWCKSRNLQKIGEYNLNAPSDKKRLEKECPEIFAKVKGIIAG